MTHIQSHEVCRNINIYNKKSDQADLTPDQVKILKKLVEENLS